MKASVFKSSLLQSHLLTATPSQHHDLLLEPHFKTENKPFKWRYQRRVSNSKATSSYWCMSSVWGHGCAQNIAGAHIMLWDRGGREKQTQRSTERFLLYSTIDSWTDSCSLTSTDGHRPLVIHKHYIIKYKVMLPTAARHVHYTLHTSSQHSAFLGRRLRMTGQVAQAGCTSGIVSIWAESWGRR